MIMFLFILAVVLSGAIGYFIAYVQNEKKSKKKSSKYNGYNGWYAYW